MVLFLLPPEFWICPTRIKFLIRIRDILSGIIFLFIRNWMAPQPSVCAYSGDSIRGKNVSEKTQLRTEISRVRCPRSLEVVASRRLAMYYKYGILIRDLKLCPL